MRVFKFWQLVDSTILDIKENIQNYKIIVVPLKKGSKEPKENNWNKINYSIEDLENHKGNFGIMVGAYHKNYSLGIIDIDGYKLKKDNENDMLRVKNKSKQYLFDCLKDIPNSLQVKTQSGGYHIYLWNRTINDKIHETSKRLHFPKDCPIPELAGKPLNSSIEIFTKNNSRQCVLPPSVIYNSSTAQEGNYELISEINKLNNMDIVDDINNVVKEKLLEHGFTYNDHSNDNDLIYETDDELKNLSDKEIIKIASTLSPVLKTIDGEKHSGSLYIGGYFSRNITHDSAEKICDIIIDEIGYIFEDANKFKNTVLNNYKSTRKDKGGLPKLIEIVKSFNPNFNKDKFLFEMNQACKSNFKHDILYSEPKFTKKKYLTIDYGNNKISTYTWNKNNKGETYNTETHDILNISPININESYNILDKNATPKLCFTFYRKGMPHKQTIIGDNIESIEKELSKRAGVVLKPREYKGILNEIINEYINLGQMEIIEEIPVQGIFINPQNGKLCRRDEKGNTKIKKPSKEKVTKSLTIWNKLYDIYPHDKTKLSHILRYGIICPFSNILKVYYDWLESLFLYGASQTSKTTLAKIALSIYTTINDDINIGGGAFDTEYRIGNALSRQGIGLIVNEPTTAIEETKNQEILKVSVESQFCREKEVNGIHTKIPAYSNVIYTSNTTIPKQDAFVRRCQYIEFTKNERLSKNHKKQFKQTFHHKNWNNTDFLNLKAIGDYIVWYVSENLDILSLPHKDIVDKMLDSLLKYAGENKEEWNWIYKDTELMKISSVDNEILNQFRRLVLKDYRTLTRQYSTEITEEDKANEIFKNKFISLLQENYIDYLHYQKVRDEEEYIVVNASVKEALKESFGTQLTCKGLADYMDCDYTTITYKNKQIKGFRMKYDEFKKFIDAIEDG